MGKTSLDRLAGLDTQKFPLLSPFSNILLDCFLRQTDVMAKAASESGNIDLITQNLSAVQVSICWQNSYLQPTINRRFKNELNSTSDDQSMDLDTEESGKLSTFHYEQLVLNKGAIRLAQVLPGAQSGVVRCELLNCTLDNCPPLAALSYTWDHDAQYENIECNGITMPIMTNPFPFLVQFRSTLSVGKRLLWVDAICINQRNVKERNHQVGQMREISTHAESVIVWLGKADDDGDLAFGLLDGPTRLINGESAHLQDLRWHRSKRHWKALQ